MPPAEPGRHSTIPPRWHGGNLDCRELVAGSTLYLPIPVDGALLSVGDGHAAQGDGEVGGTAIECPMERIDLTLDLRDSSSTAPLTTPVADTPAGWVCMGVGDDLDEAAAEAMDAMLDLLGPGTGWDAPTRWRWRASWSTCGSPRWPTRCSARTPSSPTAPP